MDASKDRFMSDEDEEAIARTLAGNSEAFGALVERYGRAVAAMAFARLRDAEEAQEVAQEAMTIAYSRLAELREAKKFAPWLYEISRNLCAAKAREREVNERAADVLVARQKANNPVRPLEIIERSEREERLRQAVEKLSPALKEVVVLRYWGGVGREEAAALLDLSLEALDKRLERALAELRTMLSDS